MTKSLKKIILIAIVILFPFSVLAESAFSEYQTDGGSYDFAGFVCQDRVRDLGEIEYVELVCSPASDSEIVLVFDKSEESTGCILEVSQRINVNGGDEKLEDLYLDYCGIYAKEISIGGDEEA